MAKNKQQLIKAMIRNIKEMDDRKDCGHYDKRVLYVYKLALSVFKNQLDRQQEPVEIDTVRTKLDVYNKEYDDTVKAGYMVFSDYRPESLVELIAERTLKTLEEQMLDYYKYDIEYRDCYAYFNGETYGDFFDTLYCMMFNGNDVKHVDACHQELVAFKLTDDLKALKVLDGFLFRSDATRRIY